MQDKYQMLADEFANSTTILEELLAQSKYNNDHFYITLRALFGIMKNNDKISVSKIFRNAEEFDKIDFNPVAKMMLYYAWCLASLSKGLKRQTEIILDKAIRFNPPHAPPMLLSMIKIMAAYAKNSGPEYLEVVLLEYKKYHKTSPRHIKLIDEYARMKCSAAMGATTSKTDNIIEEFKNEISSNKDIYYYKFLNDMGACNFDSIQKYFSKIDQNAADLFNWLVMYDLLVKGEMRREIKPEMNSRAEFFNVVLKTNYYLLHHQLDNALIESQKEKGNILWDNMASNFLKYTKIRVELCNKNMEAAFQLLKAKISVGDRHYMDDFFLARVELLRGNREKAFQYISKAHQQCEYYLALNRLRIEMDMSLELKPSDVFFLGKNFEKNTSSEKVKINYDEILNVKKLEGVNRLIGDSDALKKIKANIVTYAATDLPLLITGETGVGKDIVARAIHEESPRKAEPFLAINCGAIAESLLQSELFGHLAGSYTGAIGESKGIFIAAGKGTVFLDEIGEISPAIQVALLRVLENNEIKPVGGSHQIPFQCRIIAATNADLELLVLKKSFREDLFYRLKRLEIVIPPLRERRRDIIPLVNHFLKTFRHSFEAPVLSEDLQMALQEFNWPGNIRQLKNEIEKMDLLQSRKSHYALEDCEFLNVKPKIASATVVPEKLTPKVETTKDETLSSRHRLEKIKALFAETPDLTRKEISRKMNISLATAAGDLKKLMDENYIIKVVPSASSRSNYFVLNQQKKSH